MAAAIGGVKSFHVKDAVILFVLTFFMTVACQEYNSTSNVTDTSTVIDNVTPSPVTSTLINITATIDDGWANNTSLWSTPTSASSVQPTVHVSEDKSINASVKEAGTKVNSTYSLQPSIFADNTNTFVSSSFSSFNKLESINKSESLTVSKTAASVHMTPVYSSESFVPSRTPSAHLIDSTQLYDAMESSQLLSLSSEMYTSTETLNLQPSESFSETLYSSSNFVTPSSRERELSSLVSVHYPGEFNFSTDSLSFSLESINPTETVLLTETLSESNFSIVTALFEGVSSLASSESVTPFANFSESASETLIDSTSAFPFSDAVTSIDYSLAEFQDNSSSTEQMSLSAEPTETYSTSLELTSIQWLQPSPISSPPDSSASVLEQISSMLSEPVLPTTTIDTSYPDESTIRPTPTTELAYWDIPSTWWEYPTESYFNSDDYYSEDSTVSHLIHTHTEFLTEFDESSTEYPTTAFSAFDQLETSVSSVSEDISPSDDESEIISPDLTSVVPEMSTSVQMIPQPSSSTPADTTDQDVPDSTPEPQPEYRHQKYIITFNGDCQPLVSDVLKIREFQAKVKVTLLDHLELEEEGVYMDRVACGSVKSYVVIYNATQNYSSILNDLVSTGLFLIQIEFPETNSSLIYRAYKVEAVSFFESPPAEPDDRPDSLDDKDITLIILACVICAVLIIIGIVICAPRMYCKKYVRSFNLNDTPYHSNMKLDDYTLTQLPMSRRYYGEDGVWVESYHSNGQALLPPINQYNNHNHSANMDSTLERSVDVGDIQLEGDKAPGGTTRTFEYTPPGHRNNKTDNNCANPSTTSLDSSSFAHDRSTENLVPGLNGSTFHGSVNPIYNGDDTDGVPSDTSDTPTYTEDTPVNM